MRELHSNELKEVVGGSTAGLGMSLAGGGSGSVQKPTGGQSDSFAPRIA